MVGSSFACEHLTAWKLRKFGRKRTAVEGLQQLVVEYFQDGRALLGGVTLPTARQEDERSSEPSPHAQIISVYPPWARICSCTLNNDRKQSLFSVHSVPGRHGGVWVDACVQARASAYERTLSFACLAIQTVCFGETPVCVVTAGSCVA